MRVLTTPQLMGILATRIGGRENIQLLIQSWRMEDGRQIDQEVCGEFERAGDMVHGLLCIVAHDKRIRRKTASCSSDTAPPGSICLPDKDGRRLR